MLGCGETPEQVVRTKKREAGVDVIFSYCPSFLNSTKFTLSGFCYVASGPMVRSSYKAGEYYIKSMIEVDRAASSSSIHHSG
ncbi:hypothetical protein DCAR_0206878 [Daucus carota subsp. sativus]|uniref:Uncharacterized protein n=1 Tax=Daucus carota subsp. sativus TaxID=79200 RepID=A0AAF0WG12_DAUCS|nr:hypothetical protein DCAR_0206878 [Daucus carota subsp. sativus]